MKFEQDFSFNKFVKNLVPKNLNYKFSSMFLNVLYRYELDDFLFTKYKYIYIADELIPWFKE